MPVNIEKDLLQPLPPLYPLKGFLWKSEKSSTSFTDFRLRKTWSSVFFYIIHWYQVRRKAGQTRHVRNSRRFPVKLRMTFFKGGLVSDRPLNTQYSILNTNV